MLGTASTERGVILPEIRFSSNNRVVCMASGSRFKDTGMMWFVRASAAKWKLPFRGGGGRKQWLFLRIIPVRWGGDQIAAYFWLKVAYDLHSAISVSVLNCRGG